MEIRGTHQASHLLNQEANWMTYGYSSLDKSLPQGNNMARNSGTEGDRRNTEIALVNRQRFRRSLWLPEDPIVSMSSSHSSQVSLLSKVSSSQVVDCDALITNQPGLVLQGLFADCCQVTLVDPKNRSMGLAHAGWTGTMHGILPQVLSSMRKHFGTNPSDVVAYFGPAICAQHYYRTFNREEQALLEDFAFTTNIVPTYEVVNDKLYCGIIATNIDLLKSLGVFKIEASKVCTFEHEDQPSARRDDPKLGGPFRSCAMATAMILP